MFKKMENIWFCIKWCNYYNEMKLYTSQMNSNDTAKLQGHESEPCEALSSFVSFFFKIY